MLMNFVIVDLILPKHFSIVWRRCFLGHWEIQNYTQYAEFIYRHVTVYMKIMVYVISCEPLHLL